jgi:hypothetical protein
MRLFTCAAIYPASTGREAEGQILNYETRFVLDTNIVSLLQRGNRLVTAHVSSHSPDEVATTVITVEEQLSGWYTLLTR